MEQKAHLLQRFFNYCGLTGFVLSLRTEVVSSKPTVESIISFLYTTAYVIPKACLIAITFIIVEITYEKFVKPKIFKDDKPA